MTARLGTSLQAVLDMAGVQLMQPEMDLRAQVEALLAEAAHLPGCLTLAQVDLPCSCLVGRLRAALAVEESPFNCADCSDTGTDHSLGLPCTSCPMGGAH